MPLQSQDPDARFAVFLNPIRDLTKNWEVDIAKYLQEYLEELAEIQITFDGGETHMNFAQAAMLIQGSTAVYSKKVEYLWQMVLQMLDLLSSKKNYERVENENDAPGTTRTAKSNTQVQLNFSIRENPPEGKNITMKGDEEQDSDENADSSKSTIRFLPSVPLHLVEKEGERNAQRINLYLKKEMKEAFGHKDDYRINRSFLTPRGCLCLEIPLEILKRKTAVDCNVVPPNPNDSIAGFFVPENFNPITQFDEFQHQEEHGEFPLTPPQTDESPEYEGDIADIPDLPMDIPDIPEIDPIQEDPVDIGRPALRKRAIEPKAPPEMSLKDLWKPFDPYANIPKRPVRAGRIRKPLACSCHKETKKTRSRNKKAKDDQKKVNEGSLESHVINLLTDKVTNGSKDVKNGVLNESCMKEGLSKLELEKQEMLGQRKTKESNPDPQEIDLNIEDNAECDDMAEPPHLDFDEGGAAEQDFELPAPHDDAHEYGALFNNPPLNTSCKGLLSDSLLYEPTSDYEALVQQWVSDYVTNAQEHITSSELTRRVNRWKKTIAPKLDLEEDRKVFDIHSYGSHILSFFPHDDVRPILFDTIAHNEDTKEVARLFLSSLMLANTYNLELSQTREGDEEMDCLQLRLLSRTRHHKQFEEYAAAPSPPIRRTAKSKRKKSRLPEVDSDEDSPPPYIPLQEVPLERVSALENTRHKRLKTNLT